MAGAETLHGAAVAVGGAGLLIRGRAGAGKSALALALIARGARLVADDRVLLSPPRQPGAPPRMAAPAPIAGLIEARGIGLIRLARVSAPLTLIADLDRPAPGRLPPLSTERLQGCAVPLLLCRDRPGLADTLIVLLRHGALVDPDGAGPPEPGTG